MIDFGNEIDWKGLTVGFVLGYAISWAYFFLTLPIFIHFLGKINGTIINYGVSWLLWTIITIAPELLDEN